MSKRTNRRTGSVNSSRLPAGERGRRGATREGEDETANAAIGGLPVHAVDARRASNETIVQAGSKPPWELRPSLGSPIIIIRKESRLIRLAQAKKDPQRREIAPPMTGVLRYRTSLSFQNPLTGPI